VEKTTSFSLNLRSGDLIETWSESMRLGDIVPVVVKLPQQSFGMRRCLAAI
jgi:hypothetical protein